MRRLMPAIGPLEHRSMLIQGQVQGVGFRPFVYKLATQLNLAGFVCNDSQGVVIHLQGPASTIQKMTHALVTNRPPLAVFHHVEHKKLPVDLEMTSFYIAPSQAQGQPSAVTVDVAVCPDCLTEMRQDADQRHRYGLINCTNCGPRYTITHAVPYDRPSTTMAGFEMCPACQSQYDDPADRRFHAQPIACAACGPVVQCVDPQGAVLTGDPYQQAAALLLAGKVLAIKGLGGFHLAVCAHDAAGVERLRTRKQRDGKPFALMCCDLATAESLVQLTKEAKRELLSPPSPIVLARAKSEVVLPAGIARGMQRLGVMLPYTPMQHLLFDALGNVQGKLPGGGRLSGVGVLVMTSANVSDEPLVIDNDEALTRLSGICDGLLWHDRPIVRCVDDSVLLAMKDHLLPVRRSRGYAPGSVKMPVAAAKPGLCVGGELKNTVALVREDQVILSQHLGDLTHVLAYEHFCKAITDLCDLYEVKPQWIACDQHPVYLSTQYAKTLAKQWGVPLLKVQHHHAHAAAVLAEHGCTSSALAMICDGVGYGEDGQSWGGELLMANMAEFHRLAHLRPLDLPGGDAAAKDIRRSGLAFLHQAFGDDFLSHPAAQQLIPQDDERAMLGHMIQRKMNCATSTAVGRLFDAAAALIGICDHNQFEGHAPMLLESQADQWTEPLTNQPLFRIHQRVLDMSPLVKHLLSDTSPACRAALFHDQLAWGLSQLIIDESQRMQLGVVALSGGVFCNERLVTRMSNQLTHAGLKVLLHQKIPANDGGLAYGQAAVAAARLEANTCV